MAKLLNNYTEEETNDIEGLLELSTAKLPYTLSVPIEKALSAVEAGQYQKAMGHYLDFFEISTSYLSFVFLRLLQEKASQDQQIQALLEAYVNKIDQKRSLSFGDWLSDLLNPMLLAAIKFIPENQLSQSFQGSIIVKRKNLLFGDKRNPSIVQIRNDYRGHSITLAESIYRDVISQLEPHFVRMLQAIKPLTSCR